MLFRSVTAESEAAVTAAEEAFRALGEKERSQVENYQALEEARKSLDIEKTKKLIDSIGEVTVDSEAAVTAAEDAFAQLSDEQRSAVENAQKLTEAREKLDAALEAARLEALKMEAVGTWRCKLDLGPLLCEVLTSNATEYGVSMYDYLEDYNVAVDLTLNEDGTYTFVAMPDALEDENQKLHDAALGFLRELVFSSASQETVNQGLTDTAPANWDELSQLIDMDEDSFFEFAYGMNKDAYADEFLSMLQLREALEAIGLKGKFQIEDEKILLNKDGSDTFGEDSAVEYSIEADVMTWENGTFSLPEFMIYPLTFTKQ